MPDKRFRVSPVITLPYQFYIVGIALLIWHPAVTASGLPRVWIRPWNILHDIVIAVILITALPVVVAHLRKKRRPLGDVSLLYILLCIISTLPLVTVPTLGIPYVRMLIVSLMTFLAVFFVSSRITAGRPRRVLFWFAGAWGSWAMVSAVRGLERIHHIYGVQPRLDFMGHTNSRAGYELVFLLILAGIGITLSRKYRLLSAFFTTLLFVSLLTSYSRGGWLALSGGIICMAGMTKGWKYSLFAALIMIVILGILPGALGEKARESVNPSYPTTVFRLGLWKQVVDYIVTNPWGGCGYESLWFTAVSWLNADQSVLVGRHAHNLYLHTWAELGILGLAGLLWLFVSIFRYLRDAEYWKHMGLDGVRIGLISCLIAICLHGMVDVTWRDYHQQILFWSLAGWISGVLAGDSR